MLSFRDRDDIISSSTLIVSVLVILGSGFYAFLDPPASVGGINTKFRSDKAQLMKKAEDASEARKRIQTGVAADTFSGATKDIDAQILAIVSKASIKHNVKLQGFRPGRAVNAQLLTQLPFAISVDGLSTDVIGFEREIETGAKKLGVNSVQMSASDPSTDQVSANINIVAYLNTPFDDYDDSGEGSNG